MGNAVEKMRERELARREMKRDELIAFLEGTKRRQSLLEVHGIAAAEDAQNLHPNDNERQVGFARLPGGPDGNGEDGDLRLTDRQREAWLYRMENEALEVINDNMELQEERRRERERREERREELENMGMDGVADPDHADDPNAQRDEVQQEERTPASSRRSSLVASDDVDDDDDDLVSNDDIVDDDDLGEMDDAEADAEADAGEDAVSEGAPESERGGEPEGAAAEETGGGGADDDERRREH